MNKDLRILVRFVNLCLAIVALTLGASIGADCLGQQAASKFLSFTAAVFTLAFLFLQMLLYATYYGKNRRD